MLNAFSVTDIGKKRKLNEDYVFTSREPIGNMSNVFIVADGMGGHKAGDYASKYTVETIVAEIQRSFEKNPVKILSKAIEISNAHIRAKSKEDESLEGMGTTVVVATVMGKYLQVANVGDSRLYIVNGEIRQVTRDHSLVEEMVRMGGIGRQEARNHPDKNIITRAIGVSDKVEIDFFSEELKPGDIILMCSDGLTNMLEDEKICEIVQKSENLETKAGELVEAANTNGGKDNISVILIDPFA